MLRPRVCRSAGPLLALFTILSLALPAFAGESVPFKGRAHETITSAVPMADGLHVTTEGSGQATHLGRFLRFAEGVIHDDGTVVGTVVFIAANLDELCLDIDGGFTPAGTLEGTYTITGGTGRFSDASGSAAFVGIPDGIHIALTFDGTISY